jgi:hypothetical protein
MSNNSFYISSISFSDHHISVVDSSDNQINYSMSGNLDYRKESVEVEEIKEKTFWDFVEVE